MTVLVLSAQELADALAGGPNWDLWKRRLREHQDQKLAQVRYAATVLDRAKPGWEDRIDLDTLDMNSIHRCVLGQLYGVRPFEWSWAWFRRLFDARSGYRAGLEALDGVVSTDVFCGFHQLEWEAEIRDRLATREAARRRHALIVTGVPAVAV